MSTQGRVQHPARRRAFIISADGLLELPQRLLGGILMLNHRLQSKSIANYLGLHRVACLIKINRSTAASLVASRGRDGRLGHVPELAHPCAKTERESARQCDLRQRDRVSRAASRN